MATIIDATLHILAFGSLITVTGVGLLALPWQSTEVEEVRDALAATGELVRPTATPVASIEIQGQTA